MARRILLLAAGAAAAAAVVVSKRRSLLRGFLANGRQRQRKEDLRRRIEDARETLRQGVRARDLGAE